MKLKSIGKLQIPSEEACALPESVSQNFDDHVEEAFQQNWLKENVDILGQSCNKLKFECRDPMRLYIKVNTEEQFVPSSVPFDEQV